MFVMAAVGWSGFSLNVPVDEAFGYRRWATHPGMSPARTARRASSIAPISPSTVRASPERSHALRLDKTRSIGFRSGL